MLVIGEEWWPKQEKTPPFPPHAFSSQGVFGQLKDASVSISLMPVLILTIVQPSCVKIIHSFGGVEQLYNYATTTPPEDVSGGGFLRHST